MKRPREAELTQCDRNNQRDNQDFIPISQLFLKLINKEICIIYGTQRGYMNHECPQEAVQYMHCPTCLGLIVTGRLDRLNGVKHQTKEISRELLCYTA